MGDRWECFLHDLADNELATSSGAHLGPLGIKCAGNSYQCCGCDTDRKTCVSKACDWREPAEYNEPAICNPGITSVDYHSRSIWLFSALFLDDDHRSERVRVALMVRSAADAFGAVDQKTRDAAVAVGYSPRSIFWTVDLPLATPVLLSGLRVVTVSTIGLVTIGALIGIPSLGSLLTDGFQRGITAEVVTGLLCTVVLALLLDALLLVFGRAITPWNRRPKRVAHGQEALA